MATEGNANRPIGLVWGDFCPYNQWVVRPDLGNFQSDPTSPKWIEDRTTGRLYLNDDLICIWFKELGELLLAVIVQPVVAAAYFLGRILMLLTCQTRDSHGNITWAAWKETALKVMAFPFAVVGLILANALGVASFGLLTRDMRKIHTSTERAYYGEDGFTLAPCFRPNATAHLLGGDPGKKNQV